MIDTRLLLLQLILQLSLQIPVVKSAGTYSSIGIAASSFAACFMTVRFGHIRVSFISIPLVALIAERSQHERILP